MLAPYQVDPKSRTEFLGCPVDAMTMDETLAVAVAAMKARRRLQHVALNVAKLVNMQKDPILRRDVEESDVVSADGMGIVWGGRLLGVNLPERVTGIDLMERLLAACEREGLRPYIFGARQDVLDRALSEIRRRHPRLEIAGARHGYYKPEDEPGIAAAIKAARADCLFIAISTPMKENFLHTWRDEIDVPFLMGVGGAIDVVAGHVRRAPPVMQSTGLEWLYRLLQEPRRMWRRYATSNLGFARLLGQALVRRYLPPFGKRMGA